MAPSHLKRAVRAFDDELSTFAQTLQQEIHELRRCDEATVVAASEWLLDHRCPPLPPDAHRPPPLPATWRIARSRARHFIATVLKT